MADRIRVIPDRVFHKLWNGVGEFDNVNEYVKVYTDNTSNKKINFNNYKIDYIQSCDLLRAIYEMNKKTINELLNENNIKPIEISHRFCIPIRTLENWMAGLRTPPDYIKLFIIEAYDIKFLPPFIYTESLNKKRGRYSESNSNEPNIKKERKIKIDDPAFMQRDSQNEDDFDFDLIDKRMREFEERYSKKESRNNSNDSSDILKITAYMDEIIKKKN